MSKSIKIILLLAIAGFAIKWIYQKPKFSSGEQSLDFKAQNIDGKEFALEDLRGDYVLLDFWGSWCGPCRKDNKKLVPLYHKYKDVILDDNSRFHMVGVAIETDERRWKNAIAKDKLEWPYHIVQLDRFNSVIAKQYGVREIPTKYLIDPKGEIISVNKSVEEIDKYLSEKSKI